MSFVTHKLINNTSTCDVSKLKKISLKKALELYEATDIKIKIGYNFRSGFFRKDKQLYYFMTPDLRTTTANLNVMTRTAQHLKDYNGGTNQYVLTPFINKLGYKINIPLTKKDYNND